MRGVSLRWRWRVGAMLMLLALAPLPWGGRAEGQARSTAAAALIPTPSCPPSLVANGHDYHGLTLELCSFAGQDLTNANFAGATLIGVVFIKARLGGADFSGATFADSGNATLPTDFTFADLSNASFSRATFGGLTYFTHATLSCADFSHTDLTTPNAVFGPSPLRIDKDARCTAPRTRTSFAYAVMNCEFVADWDLLDMSHATGLQACQAQLVGHDFSNALLDFADLSDMDLSGTTWTGASLRRADFQGSKLDGAKGLDGGSNTLLAGANFIDVSAMKVDFGGGKLNGADFSRAELQGANFAGATLINDPKDPLGPITQAGKFDGAHLKYVNFSGATLNSVSFKYASLYGDMDGAPPSSCQTDTSSCSSTGWTCSCATLANADLTRTDFSNAFLYGVDFSSDNGNTKINGTTFSGAVLVGANFQGAAFGIDTSQGGQATTLDGAWLQGVNLEGADLTGVSMAGAYVDFGVLNADGSTRPGSRLALQLTTNHTRFRNWAGSATPCVHVESDDASDLPTDIGSLTCPDGGLYATGCGDLLPRDNTASAAPTNPRWFGGTVPSAVGIVGWYMRQSTYEDAAASTAQCNGQPKESGW